MEFITNNGLVSFLTAVILFTVFGYMKDNLLRKSKLKKKLLSGIDDVSELKEWFGLHKSRICLDDIDQENNETRLTQAVKNNELKFARAIIALGASTSSLNSEGQNPMHVAIYDDNKKFRKLLFKSSYDIEATNSDGYTALHLSVKLNNMDIIKECLSKKASINTDTKLGSGLIHTAASIQQPELINFLIDKGADIDHKDKLGNTPLHIAVKEDIEESCEYILKAGADIELKNENGERALHVSAANTTSNIANILIKYKASIDPVDNLGFSPLMTATDYDNVNIMKLLIEHEANVDKKDNSGNTPLFLALKNDNPATTTILLDSNANVDATDRNNTTPLLMLTKISTNVNLMDILIKHNANVDATDSSNDSAIMKAVSLDKEKFVKRLMIAKASIETNNYKLITVALDNNNPSMLYSLVDYGALVSERNIETAIEYNVSETLRSIISPFKNKTPFLQSMLERAVRSRKLLSVKVLMLLVNIDTTGSIAIAASLGYQDMLSLLLVQSRNPTFTKLIDVLHIDNNHTKAKLTLQELILNDVGGEIIYSTNDKNFRISSFAFDVERDLALDRVVLKDNRSGTHSVYFYNSTPLGRLVKDLKINDKNVRFLRTESTGISKYIFIEHIDGSTLGHWFDKQGYIEDVLKMSVEIEMYDNTHEFYGKYGKTKMILIKESDLSSIPSLCNLSGVFAQVRDNHGSKEIHFTGITDEQKWKNSEAKISELLGKSITVDVHPDPQTRNQYKVILRIAIEYSIPELLDWSDNKHLPQLLYVKKEKGMNTYFYSYSHNKDILAWKEASRKVNLRTLFDQPDRVYILEMYNRENSKLWNKYSGEFTEKNLIALHEYDAIPSKGDLMKFDPTSELRLNEVLWGYGSAASRYYTKINDMAHMMIIGGTGSGKSNFINGIILSLLHNIKQVQKLYLIDLKSGIEFNRYKDLNPNKVNVFSKGTSPSKLLAALKEVEAEMCLREQYMSDVGIVQYPDNPIFIIIDEYAQIELMPGKGAEMMAKDDILDLLVRIGTKARSANIKLIVQTQNPRAVQEELKANLMSRALLKTSKSADLSLTLQDEDMAYDLGFKHISFDKGRFIFEDYNDGNTKMTELQFPFIDTKKKYHEKYKGSTKASHNSKLDKYKQSVVNDYPYLAETAVLSGTIGHASQSVSTPIDSYQPKPQLESQKKSTAKPFDFNAMLKPSAKSETSATDLNSDVNDEVLADINDLSKIDSEALNMLNKLLGEE